MSNASAVGKRKLPVGVFFFIIEKETKTVSIMGSKPAFAFNRHVLNNIQWLKIPNKYSFSVISYYIVHAFSVLPCAVHSLAHGELFSWQYYEIDAWTLSMKSLYRSHHFICFQNLDVVAAHHRLYPELSLWVPGHLVQDNAAETLCCSSQRLPDFDRVGTMSLFGSKLAPWNGAPV